MKTLQRFLGLLLFTALVTGFSACSDDDDAGNIIENNQTIAEFVADSPDYSMLAEALNKADLTATLDGAGTFTVFAPNNAAFTAYLNGAKLADLNTAAVKQLLLNHVLGSTVLSKDLTTGYVTNLATFSDTDANLSMYFNVDGNTPMINGGASAGGADITKADNIFKNGVVHAVNAVIAIPTVVTFATADPTFSNLVAALTREDDFNYVATLSTPIGTAPAPFTVLAPTNAAFDSLLADDLGGITLADVDTATLMAALNLHVIANANVRAAALTSGTVTTLGGDITIDADAKTITDANGRVSNIVVTDVQAGNGVIHAIDKVILPMLESEPKTIAAFVAGNADYSMLAAALDKTGLDATLGGEGTFTVFAPNNKAFTAYLDGTSLDDVDKDALTQLLLNHVLGSVALSKDLATSYVTNLASYAGTDAKLSMYINVDGDVPMINGGSAGGGANITATDMQFDNGVVHGVDKVIALPTVVTFATSNPDFSSLVAALTREDDFTYVATLNTAQGTAPAPFTVFAPTNVAFASLLADDLGGITLADVPKATLKAALDLHVIAGANVRAADLTNGDVETLGGKITVNADNSTLTDSNGRVSTIKITDVQATNGVVHAIDKVLLPKL